MAKKYLVSETTKNKLMRVLNTGPPAPESPIRFREAPSPGGGAILFQAPAGGIPAMNLNRFQPGAAECTKVLYDSNLDALYQDVAARVVVRNWLTSAVCTTGSRMGVAVSCNGQWFVVADNCQDNSANQVPTTPQPR